jgi:hypothetical protein
MAGIFAVMSSRLIWRGIIIIIASSLSFLHTYGLYSSALLVGLRQVWLCPITIPKPIVKCPAICSADCAPCASEWLASLRVPFNSNNSVKMEQ